jgi:hypothetical protein
MSAFFKGQTAVGAPIGSNRRYTPWAKRQEKQHSILWLIEHAVTLEMLQDVLKGAAYQTNASPDTRRRWADAAEKRAFILRHRPPIYEKISVEETGLQKQKPGTVESFEAARRETLGFLGLAPDAPEQRIAQVLQHEELKNLVAIEAAEVPRPVDPAAVVLRESEGALRTYSDGVKYGLDASKTVTRMQVVARRTKCPPWPTPGLQANPIDPAEYTCTEWDVLFFCGLQDITREVVTESHPDQMRKSHVTPNAAVFNAESGVAPVAWKLWIESRFGTKIEYDQSNLSIQRLPRGQLARGSTPLETIEAALKRCDDIPAF